MNKQNVPDVIVSRLPVYLRALQRLSDAGVTTTSSQELGEKVGISAAQIRKDLSQFGEFGKQGTGYHIPFLIERLSQILNVDRIWDVGVVGMGDIGHAIVRYNGFSNRGFQVAMCFDADPAKIGTKVGEFEIRDEKNLIADIKAASIKIAMICVPASVAQDVADKLVEAGVRGILNYAPLKLIVPANVRVQHIDPAIGLQRITYYIA
ncbi:MAG: redox-sensing transcriptional repressor Rex [Chloroflexi bacterium HGW-Chloroflexi-6]|nr:MAG: redox-sensing transcriptional repressor Rex [Chloroflexi bacterium HGW-Chloroflexi-6]